MIKCSVCGSEVRVIPFGSSFIAVCCGRIIYRGYKLPETEMNAADTNEFPETVIFFDEK